jgi:hypothetical protein
MATAKWYGPAINRVLTKVIDLSADTIKVALCTSTYTPNYDTHGVYTDLTNQTTGTGYTAGGITLTSKTITQDTTNDWWTFDAADVTWSSASFSFRYAIIYDDTAASKPLIAAIDFGSTQTASSQDLTIKWESMSDSGILRGKY